jgi:uncharacterized membrane protein YebE (DUF533 family)
MLDPARLLQSLFSSPTARGFAGGMAGSLLLGKSGRKLVGKAAKIGGLAAIGALAYRAFQNHQAAKSGAAGPRSVPPTLPHATAHATELLPPPDGSGFLPPPSDTAARESLGLTLVRAMVAAAKADGKLDATESKAILGSLQERGLDADERAALLDELARPVDLDRIVAAAPTPQLAAEVYIAARSAIDPDTAAERAWLAMLAARLGLDTALVERLEHELG